MEILCSIPLRSSAHGCLVFARGHRSDSVGVDADPPKTVGGAPSTESASRGQE